LRRTHERYCDAVIFLQRQQDKVERFTTTLLLNRTGCISVDQPACSRSSVRLKAGRALPRFQPGSSLVTRSTAGSIVGGHLGSGDTPTSPSAGETENSPSTAVLYPGPNTLATPRLHDVRVWSSSKCLISPITDDRGEACSWLVSAQDETNQFL
jgi:hypothetical protein